MTNSLLHDRRTVHRKLSVNRKRKKTEEVALPERRCYDAWSQDLHRSLIIGHAFCCYCDFPSICRASHEAWRPRMSGFAFLDQAILDMAPRNKLNRKILFECDVAPGSKNSKISDFHENSTCSRKSTIFAKIRDFWANLRLLRKSAKIRDFRKNPRFSQKSQIFAKISDFGESGIFAKISVFYENPGFLWKISDFDENLDGFQIHFTP